MKLFVFTLETCTRKVIKNTVQYYRLKVLLGSDGGLWDIGHAAADTTTIANEYLEPNGLRALRQGGHGDVAWAEVDGSRLAWADWFTFDEMEAARAAADASEIDDVALGWKTAYLIWDQTCGAPILQADERILPSQAQDVLNVFLRERVNLPS